MKGVVVEAQTANAPNRSGSLVLLSSSGTKCWACCRMMELLPLRNRPKLL